VTHTLTSADENEVIDEITLMKSISMSVSLCDFIDENTLMKFFSLMKSQSETQTRMTQTFMTQTYTTQTP